MAIRWSKGLKGNFGEKTALQRVEYFLKKNCRNVAEVFAKIHFLDKHPAKKFPEYYEDNTKGRMFGNFDHPKVMEESEKIIKQVEDKLNE